MNTINNTELNKLVNFYTNGFLSIEDNKDQLIFLKHLMRVLNINNDINYSKMINNYNTKELIILNNIYTNEIKEGYYFNINKLASIKNILA